MITKNLQCVTTAPQVMDGNVNFVAVNVMKILVSVLILILVIQWTFRGVVVVIKQLQLIILHKRCKYYEKKINYYNRKFKETTDKFMVKVQGGFKVGSR